MDQENQSIFSKHINALYNVIAETKEFLEGNIIECPGSVGREGDQIRMHNLITLSSNANQIFEIGFNSGFSCLLFLIYNPKAKVIAVDIGLHAYVNPCYEYLREIFGDRIQLFIGDSTVLLSKDPVVRKCISESDFFHIDGGHSFDVALADIKNCHELAKEGAIVVVDDIQYLDVGKAWKECIDLGHIQEYRPSNCKFNYGSIVHGIGKFCKTKS